MCSLLARKYDAVEEQLEQDGAAPPAFLAAVWPLVQPAESTAAAAEAGSASALREQPPTEELPPAPQLSPTTTGKQASIGSFFGTGARKHYEKLPSGERVLHALDGAAEKAAADRVASDKAAATAKAEKAAKAQAAKEKAEAEKKKMDPRERSMSIRG